ncbi:RDD family protein [Staphylococcus pseudoxylosus]|uniref:RDD family protein n=1 Tax=Staphylococcus pseudoxylosus TaxID=2282419 RepID=UPI000D1D628E|nr:RDD family protein [Staphylococcus pseudoxylosus]PTI58720.1 RDD family protein [Staphylococcus xylosus]MDW8798503.1 RDD family protein [Staphylococcus pseudoxylosus]MEB6036080.1 RDD family protein [Staphylococcus pseudoxylosus]MEB6045373.1 RDD family protein [Staphylococcus pseudoxylosus]MEB6059671.1 RDD family protein [Staphylococcus pseudoxylosus]
MKNIQNEYRDNEKISNDSKKDETSDLYHEQISKALYAGFGIRFFAFIIDLLIIFGVESFILKPIYHFTNINSLKLLIDYFSVEHLLNALVFYLYFVLLTKYFKQTLGKMICNVRVERIDRQRLTWQDVLFREWIGRIISGVFMNLPYLVVIFTNKHRGVHDYFADTVVIKNKLDKLFYLK